MPENLPSIVYHYTSMETLLKIVDSGQIRATSIRYLNDVSERAYALSAIQERLEYHPQEIKNLFEPLFESTEENRSFVDLPFVASFSGLRDSLPQWRSYCSNGNGVSIGFAVESLQRGSIDFSEDANMMKPLIRPLSEALVMFEPVKYLKREDDKAFDYVIDEILEGANQIQKEYNKLVPECEDDEGRKITYFLALEPRLSSSLDVVASRIKQASFEAENEYRLTVRLCFALKQIEYRCAASTLVPFVSVSIPNPSEFATPRKKKLNMVDAEKPFFIDSVTIGPSPNTKLSKQALHGYFLGRGYDVTIHESKIPFRDWL